MSVTKVSTLRAALASPVLAKPCPPVTLGYEATDRVLKGGIQRGALHEIFAVPGHEATATGFVAGLAHRVGADKHLLWIRQDFSTHEFGELSPTGFAELGLDPARMLFLSVPNANDGLRAANDALSCAALGAVVLEVPGSPKALDLMTSRRLTLAAAQKSVTAFLLRFNAKPEASTSETRWQVRAAVSPNLRGDWGHPVFDAELVRNRHGKTGRWLMEWNCDEYAFQSPAAHHGALVSALADRQAQAA